MKKPSRAYALLCHAVIVLAGASGVLAVLDLYNPMMGFLAALYSRAVLLSFCVLALVLGIVSARRDRRSAREPAEPGEEDTTVQDQEEQNDRQGV